MKKRVWYISQLADPHHINMDIYNDCPGRDNELIWVENQLSNIGMLDQIEYRGARVERGDELPDLADVDIAFLGGSYHSVHDNFQWQKDLQNWLAAYRQTGKPLFGICGGHQQMATYMGSTVGQIENGPMAATLDIDLTEAGKEHFLYQDIPADQLKFHFGNYEHVEKLPEGGTVLATRPEMPVMAIDYGQDWYSVQYHPEAHRQTFAAGWNNTHPEFAENYVEVPHAPKMLKNYLERYL